VGAAQHAMVDILILVPGVPVRAEELIE